MAKKNITFLGSAGVGIRGVKLKQRLRLHDVTSYRAVAYSVLGLQPRIGTLSSQILDAKIETFFSPAIFTIPVSPSYFRP